MNISAINWFEIPAADLARAARFYGAILGADLRYEEVDGYRLAVFPYAKDEGGISGCLIHGEGYRPADTGVTIYLNAAPRLQDVLDRVAPAGGRIVLGATQLPEGMGVFAHILDTEGNRVGLHALQ